MGRRGGGVGCRGLLGWVCPKRRGLKPRWRGCLQETRRWPGVFVVFPVCFRCVFGVALHGARADLLRFGHLAPSMRRTGTRAGPSGGPGQGARGRVSIVVDEGLHRQRGFGADREGRGLVIGGGVALRAAAPVDGWNPRHLRPSLRGAPGATKRASRPRLLRTVQHLPAQQTQLAETRESS